MTQHLDNNIRKWIHILSEKKFDDIKSRNRRNAYRITDDIGRKIVK